MLMGGSKMGIDYVELHKYLDLICRISRNFQEVCGNDIPDENGNFHIENKIITVKIFNFKSSRALIKFHDIMSTNKTRTTRTG